jgi:putative tryptophan/tyrosine transport system substrate-binding protein
MDRRAFVGIAGSLLALLAGSRVSRAQPKVARIGFLVPLAADDPEVKPRIAAFSRALRDLGWAEGRTLRIEYRYSAGDAAKMRQHAAELVALAPDLMVVQSNQALAVMRQVDRSIPTVFLSVSDPVGDGFVASLSRPGGNATGFANYEPAMGSKWLQVLKELVPATTRVMVLLNSKIAANVQLSRNVESAAESFGMRCSLSSTTDGAEMERAIAAFARERNGGLIVMPNPSNRVHEKAVIEACARHRLPAVYPFTYVAKAGGLVGYGLDHLEMFQGAASYVDRILKGAAPGGMPVQLPTRFELAINLRTAKLLGLTVPSGLLARANEVIE